MGEGRPDILKHAVVQKGRQKGAVINPLTAQEEANNILELIGRATPKGYNIDNKAKQALGQKAGDYVLTAQAEKTVQAEKKSLKDPLTKILNREGIYQEIKKTMSEVDREGGSLTVVFMDLRHFRSFNNQWGHDVGDKALLALVKSVQQSIRPYDEIGRWGGEEFLLLIKSGEAELAQSIYDRMHQSLRGFEAPLNQITVDMGSEVYSQSGPKLDSVQLIQHADQAMYYAKKHRLDKVMTWDPLLSSVVVPDR